jgi:large subunit ribosomal protein L29
MANDKARELAGLSDDEVREQLSDAKGALFKLRFQRAVGQLENHAAIKKTKRDVARVMTEIRAREIASAEALAEGSNR